MHEQQALLVRPDDPTHYGTPHRSDALQSSPVVVDASFSPRRYARTVSSCNNNNYHNNDDNAGMDVIDIDTSARRRRPSSVAALAAAEVILHDREQRRESRSLFRRSAIATNELEDLVSSDGLSSHDHDDEEDGRSMRPSRIRTEPSSSSPLLRIASQIPAIAIVSILNFMIGIPFGASYFPVEWSAGASSTEFPLPGKEALGLRMFLFSTAAAQAVLTFASKFVDGVGLQMVENVPFCLELARIVTGEVGYGRRALSTLFFLFGLSSVAVGAVFYLLGKFSLGRVVYFFPSHVLVGCIGGIGAFIVTTSLEVSTNTTFHFTIQGMRDCVLRHFHLLAPVLAFEILLRILMHVTNHRYPLLSPMYYCAITPVFYLMLWGLDVDFAAAENAGYFFPPLAASGSVLDEELFRIFTIVDLTTVSWTAVAKSFPTMVSLTAFSLIHVPINIPAFAVSTNVDPDMNAELMAHGYSNALSGIFGGLANYMAYSNSVIYSKANGGGTASSLGIVAATVVLFVYGPAVASFVPRCMAGTLLLHVGVDLFLEGVYESRNDYDGLEYAGIWLITVVMVSMGMDAALVAGVIAALSTYAGEFVASCRLRYRSFGVAYIVASCRYHVHVQFNR
ncbi:hypothetical protein ACHAWX_005444 [Stephanocyclus meneghinianus]